MKKKESGKGVELVLGIKAAVNEGARLKRKERVQHGSELVQGQ